MVIMHQMPQPRLGPHPQHPRRRPGARVPHTPLRPRWTCRAWCQQWPCAQARLLLKAEREGRMASLAIYLAGLMYEAMHDLYCLNPNDGPSPRALFERFVAWNPFRRSAAEVEEP
ncbi:hypothetical protein [Salinispora cortesiana]|uniref:hypothetical protein n=1 Tax=Salinispora cortesiana TaxID=1305843 RepID=UPI00047133D9|nr:hypothetical protein [Salinispora cortesiana]